MLHFLTGKFVQRLLLGFAACASIFILPPLTVQYFQSSEFLVDGASATAIGGIICLALGLIVALFSIIVRMRDVDYFRICATVIIFLVIFDIFLPTETGEIVSGVAAETTTFDRLFSYIVPTLILLSLVLLSYLNSEKFESVFYMAITVGICFIIFAVSVSVVRQIGDDSPNRNPDDFVKLSGDGDIIVILFDELRGRLVKKVFQEDPKLEKTFKGYTFFEEAASASPRTAMSLPNIMSGTFYPGKKAQDWMNEATAKNSFMKDAQNAGYEPRYFQTMDATCGTIPCISARKYATQDPLTESIYDYARLVRFGFARTMPSYLHIDSHFEKSAIESFNNLIGNVDAAKNEVLTHPEMFKKSFDKLVERLEVDPSITKRLIFYHATHTHLPVDFTADCIFKRRLGISAEAIFGEAKCGMSQLASFNERLKEMGIYDQTSILIISDHGENSLYYHSGYKPSEFAYVPGEDEHYNPTIMIKPANKSEPLRYSVAPAALADIRKTVCEILENCKAQPDGLDLLKLPEDSDRIRKIMHFRYGKGLVNSKGEYPKNSYRMVEFKGRFAHLKNAMFQPHFYKIGTKIDFSKTGNGHKYTFTGWSMPQAEGRYLDGRSGDAALMTLKLDQPVADNLTLNLVGNGYVSNQNVTVSVNGTKLGEWQVIAGGNAETQSIPIPTELVRGKSALNIAIRPDAPKSPHSMNPANADRRLLSIIMHSLRVESHR